MHYQNHHSSRINNDKRAMKVIARENVVGKEHLIEMELAILQKIDHTFIVQLYDSWFVEDSYYLSLELIEVSTPYQSPLQLITSRWVTSSSIFDESGGFRNETPSGC